MIRIYDGPIIDARHHLWDLRLARHPDPADDQQRALLHDNARRFYRFDRAISAEQRTRPV